MGDLTGYELGNAPYTIPKHVWSCTRLFCDSQMDLEHKVDQLCGNPDQNPDLRSGPGPRLGENSPV